MVGVTLCSFISAKVLVMHVFLLLLLCNLCGIAQRRRQQGDIEVIEFVEAYLEVLTAFGDAENDLYSANFAEYAGGGGMKVRDET